MYTKIRVVEEEVYYDITLKYKKKKKYSYTRKNNKEIELMKNQFRERIVIKT